MGRRLVIVLVVLMLAGIAGENGEKTAAHVAFGTLRTDPVRAGDERRAGVTLAMMELSWAAYEPRAGEFDDDYAAEQRQRLETLREAGMRVTLGLGLHFPPDWVAALPDSRYADQGGAASTEVNLVFNKRLREAAERYLARVTGDLTGVDAIRLTSGGLPEVLYPGGGRYWAFDRNARNGPDLPSSMAPNPAPDWRPGERSIPRETVRAWADWYVGALADVVAWQVRVLDAYGFGGSYEVLTPGSGTRPDGFTRDVAAYLPDGVTGVGAVWDRFYAILAGKADRRRIIAYVSSVADRSGGDDGCVSGDGRRRIGDPALDRWSASRWIARLAREYGFAVGGENPGWNQPAALNPHYRGGMLAAATRQAVSCGFRVFYWAHDENLWQGPLTFGDYAEWIKRSTHS